MAVLQIPASAWREIFPRAPQKYIDGLVKGKSALDKAGVTSNKRRFSYCMANVEHECGGFTIPNLTENINYSAARMAQVWPNRFGSAADVERKYGNGPGWQKKAFDDIYGNRMGNRPGSTDGSRYIGRGGPQITGRDGYAEIEKRTGIPLVANPELAALPENQAAIIAAFWSWKGLNAMADAGRWRDVVVRWNGGTNGLADRNAKMAGNDPIVERLRIVENVEAATETLPTRPQVTPQAGGAGAVIVGGGTAAAVAVQQGADISTIVGIAIAAVIVAGIAYFIIRKFRDRP